MLMLQKPRVKSSSSQKCVTIEKEQITRLKVCSHTNQTTQESILHM